MDCVLTTTNRTFPATNAKGKLFHMDANQGCLIEVVDQSTADEQEEVAEDPVTTTEINLQAFSGAFNPWTICLIGWVLNQPLSILIDIGRTHNFIKESMVARLGDICRRVEINIQNTIVIEDLFVWPMGGANIVLDIQWLAKLGPVTTNHKELTMEFNIRDK